MTQSRALQDTADFFDGFAAEDDRWRRKNRGYSLMIQSVMRFLVPGGASVLEIGSGHGELLARLEPSRGVGVDVSPRMAAEAAERYPDLDFVCDAGERFVRDETFDYIVYSDVVQYADDILAMFQNAARMSHPRTRVIVNSYSQVWRPVIRVAEWLRLMPKRPLRNWVSPEDIRNLLGLAGFEVVSSTRRILFPKRLYPLSTVLNGIIGNIWPFTWLTLTYWIVARPQPEPVAEEPLVSVVVPCRNEAGTIAEIIERVPEMGAGTEIVFVEGGSTDDTRAEIERQMAIHPERRISLHDQPGKGKGDAVRVGLRKAEGDVLMILDADLTVSPEDLPKFYDALISGRAELVNGSRLVYDFEAGAMRFLNVIGNKAFSLFFAFLLGQFVKDTLCGTKVLFRSDYDAIEAGRSTFGDFDPFGDFDLLLGAAKLGLKITDMPIRYGSRRYGETNISRWSHGYLLLRMTVIAWRRFKIDPVRV